MKFEIEKKDAVYAFVQARFRSKRLPGKVMRSLAGKNLLAWSVQRAQNIHPNVNVAVLTGDNPENDVIVSWCKENKIVCIEGRENDVLNRFNKAAVKLGAKTVIRLTADNPLVDFKKLFTLLSDHIIKKSDYSSNKTECGSGMPDGIGGEIFSAKVLFCLDSMHLSDSDCEHVNEYILRHTGEFKCVFDSISIDYSSYSFTIDTEEDLKRVDYWMRTVSPGRTGEFDYWKRVIENYQ